MTTKIKVGPQPGPQEQFLSTSADIAIYGGAAGGGKSYALLLEPLRHIHNRGFGAVIFRRTSPQIRNEGGLWDTSNDLYPYLGARPKESTLEHVFRTGAKVRFAHMEHEKDRHHWQGSQIPFIGFDELVHFTWKQFNYMLSRNRSTCGIRPYIRATTNPDPDHFSRKLVDWYVNRDSGIPIPERGGVIRWFAVINDIIEWGATRDELVDRFGPDVDPKSFTFIPSSVYDNRILLRKDPGYLANLKALSKIDRARLLGGNWNIREAAGMFFERAWFEIVDAVPGKTRKVRYWDLAATEGEADPNDRGGPSWTAGLKMERDVHGMYYISALEHMRKKPLGVETAVKNTASQDGTDTTVGLEQDPGQAGKVQVQYLARQLAGYRVMINRVVESKGKRASPLSAQAEAGNVKLIRAPWNERFLNQAENFDGTDSGHADIIDSASGAFLLLTTAKRAGTWG